MLNYHNSSFLNHNSSIYQLEIPIDVPTDFVIQDDGAGKAPVSVSVRSPAGRTVLPMVEEHPQGHHVTFIPREPGPHDISIAYGGVSIPSSPYTTTCVEPVTEEQPIQAQEKAKPVQATQMPVPDAGKVKAYGDGLYRGITTKPAEFTIDTREAGPGALGLTIEGPIEAKMEARDLGDGTCQVTYYPTEAGEYTINIFYCNEPIPGVPYVANIQSGVVIDVSGVTAYGPGLQPNGMELSSALHGFLSVLFDACLFDALHVLD